MFLAIWHEPENDMKGCGSGKTEADYAAMYRYDVTRLRSLGVTNAVFVMNYMGFSGWSDIRSTRCGRAMTSSTGSPTTRTVSPATTTSVSS